VEIKRNFCIDHLVISISISRWCSSIPTHGFPSAPLPTTLPNPATTATDQTLQVFTINFLSIFNEIETISLHFNPFHFFFLNFYLQFHLLFLFIFLPFIVFFCFQKSASNRCSDATAGGVLQPY